MLVLGRKQGESIRIGSEIEVTIVGISGNRVRLGIQAPADVRVLRQELDEREHLLTTSPPKPSRQASAEDRTDRRSVA